MDNPTILITGAAGNLGGLLSKSLQNTNLHLLTHKKEVSEDLKNRSNIKIFKADLGKKETLYSALEGVNTIVHFAGVLFKARPEKFLPITNTLYFSNLLDVAVEQGVQRIILVSFPHVEGETTPQNPATGRLDGNPTSVHTITRLQEEQELFRRCSEAKIEAVSLRVGMVYGKGILMIDTAGWFSKHYLMGIWKRPTYIHLISKDDFLSATMAAIDKEHVSGIYHIGDEGVQTLQDFFDKVAKHEGYRKPWRMPNWMIMTAAQIFEWFSALFGTRSPLTKDFVRIGQVSYYGDTTRMRNELLPELKYKTFEDGLETFGKTAIFAKIKIDFDNLTAEQVGKLFPIRIVPYNPDWKILFKQEKAVLTSVLGEDIVLNVEHFGSTSVEGLAAKPTIDIMVEVSNLSENIKQVITEKLATIGYGNMYSAEKGNRMTFGKGYDENYLFNSTYHVHIREKGNVPQDEIYFRDYLCKNSDARDEYAQLKYELAEKHQFNREDYTQGKTGFITKIKKQF